MPDDLTSPADDDTEGSDGIEEIDDDGPDVEGFSASPINMGLGFSLPKPKTFAPPSAGPETVGTTRPGSPTPSTVTFPGPA